MKKRIISVILALCLSFATSAQSAYATLATENVDSTNSIASANHTMSFSDVHEGDWCYDVVNYMVVHGFIDGFSDNTFRPGQTINRVQFAKILFNALPMSEPSVSIADSVKEEFREMNNSYWGCDVILEALERGVVGIGTSIYDLVEAYTQPIPREEMAYFVDRAARTTSVNANLTFIMDIGCVIGDYGDCLASKYCFPILLMTSSGVIGGVNFKHNFSPKAFVTRGAACAIINRLLDPNIRENPASYEIHDHDAPVYTEYLSCAFEDVTQHSYDVPPVDYDNLDSARKGSYTSHLYGGMTEKEASEVEAVVDRFLTNYIRPTMSDLKKACIAAEYIMEVCSYGDDDAPRAYTAWGALVGNAAWCTGFSYAYKVLCDAMGLSCVAVPANNEAVNPSHMWNAVKIDGYWYIIDVQATDISRDIEVYNGPDDFFGHKKTFYLISSERYMKLSGMKWNVEEYPVCQYNYFQIDEGSEEMLELLAEFAQAYMRN